MYKLICFSSLILLFHYCLGQSYKIDENGVELNGYFLGLRNDSLKNIAFRVSNFNEILNGHYKIENKKNNFYNLIFSKSNIVLSTNYIGKQGINNSEIVSLQHFFSSSDSISIFRIFGNVIKSSTTIEDVEKFSSIDKYCTIKKIL